jgi:hypothetical protein
MHYRRWIASGLLALLLSGMARPACAQSDAVPPEMQQLFSDLDDIDKLRILNPLKLKPEQLDRIIAAVRHHQKDYLTKLAAAAVPPIKTIAQEIKATRRRLLTGGDIPKEFDDKVKKMQADYVKKREAQDFATLKGLSDAIRNILSAEQLNTAVALSKKMTEKDGQPTMKGTDAEFFHLYVLGTFVAYSRIVPLLEDMRKAMGGAETPTGSGREKTGNGNTQKPEEKP